MKMLSCWEIRFDGCASHAEEIKDKRYATLKKFVDPEKKWKTKVACEMAIKKLEKKGLPKDTYHADESLFMSF